MFDVGLPEMLVLLIVGVLVFGPDRLPDFARQAGRFVRQVRQFTQAARDDIRAELGPEFADFELSDLDPRRAVRKYVQDAWEQDDAEPSAGFRPLEPGELPPYDSDAT
ncbi:MAG: sec-independent translocase [Nocardioidaceae bacterium]